jgi:hypothetical protein
MIQEIESYNRHDALQQNWENQNHRGAFHKLKICKFGEKSWKIQK